MVPTITVGCNHKATIVRTGTEVFYFSYVMCIGYSDLHDINIRLANSWGPTTGKHFNWLGISKWKVVSIKEFEKIIGETR